MLRIGTTAFLLLALSAPGLWGQKKPKNIKPGFNLFKVEQDIQLGKEYAAQVEQQMTIVRDAPVAGFIERLGARLASAPEAKGFPFSFKVVHEKSINAFALPGGPTFTHTGLITAADNEAQIAGVLAHEISHVVLRHGTNQVSKAQLLQLPAMLGGELLGSKGGIAGMLGQLGVGLGANSLMLKFSRNAESDADLLGARIMHQAGYNPIEMARFFEKLEAETGKGNWISNMMSDHPNPGNRVKAVQDEIQLLSRRDYDPDSGQIGSAKQAISRLPEPRKRPAANQPSAQSPGGSGDPRNFQAARPSNRLRTFQRGNLQLSHPENWEVFGDPNSPSFTIANRAGLVGQATGYGVIANFLDTGGAPNLSQQTGALIQQFQQGDPSIRATGNARQFNLDGNRALATRLQANSPFEGTGEAIVLISIERPRGMFYLLFIAPERDLNYAQPIFDQMIGSIRFQ